MNFIVTLLVAAVTAALSANLAIGRFKKERAWEKKREAFSLLIKGIKSAINYSEGFISYTNSFPSAEDEQHLSSLLKARSEAKRDAEKILYDHYLFMPDHEINLVKSLFEEINFPDYMDSEEAATNDLAKHEELLERAENYAKRSLQIPQSNAYLILSSIGRKADKLLSPIAKKLS